MKPIRNIFASLFLLGGFIAFDNLLPAQETISSISATNDASGLSDLEVEEKAIEMMTPIAATNAPIAGNFYSAQHAPGTPEEWPPLPGNWLSLPVWEVDTNLFLVDDLDYNYEAVAKTTLKARSGMSAPGFGADGVSPDFGSPSVPDYGTNLWLAITNLAGNTAGLLLSNTVADIKYEIQGAADLTDTNWISEGFVYGSELTNWTPANIAATNYPNLFLRVRSWQDSDGSGLPDWWQLQYFGTTGVDPNGDPMGDGWSNIQKFQNGMNPNVFYTPPAPQGLTAVLNQPSHTAVISWLPSPGAVTGYAVERDDDSGATDFSFSTSTNGFVDNISAVTPNPYSGNSLDVTYKIKANYTNGNSSAWSASIPLQPPTVSATITAGTNGATYLAIWGVPANAATVQLVFIDYFALFFGDTSFDYTEDIPVSSFTNGLYQLPTAWQPPTDSYDNADYEEFVASVDTNGDASGATQANEENWNSPFYDGRIQLKQNLIFLLRAATVDYPFGFTEVDADGGFVGRVSYSANCASASFYQVGFEGGSQDVLQPFEENYLFRNFVLSSTDVDTNGLLTTGASLDTFAGFDNDLILGPSPSYSFTGVVTNSALLATNETRWLLLSAFYYEMALASSSGQMETNVSNIFGLPFLSTETAYATDSGLMTNTIYPGDSIGTDPNYYSETAQPQFQTVEYDFWTPNLDWLPGSTGFSTTNTSRVLIAPVGNAINIAGYAKLAVQNGYPGVYGYLGQYFDKAYQVTNGVVTTNQTGILSSYGDFFATEPGPAALVTMPDLDTGERGTCTVYAVSLQLDANHDGNMDLSFNGGDATSASSPMTFWANNNYDRWTYDSDDNTNYQDDKQIAGCPFTPNTPTPDCNYRDVFGNRVIPGTRDLQDFFRFWVCGITSNLLAALPTNSTITLNWGDVGSPNSANPTIDFFAAADADGGIGYLTNETIAAEQTNSTLCPYIGRLGPGQSLQLNASTFANHWAGNHFIMCGVSNGTGGLNLTITDGNGNVLGQATSYIQIVDIKQMYERWTVGDQPSVAPTNTAYVAADGLTGSELPFRFSNPATTGTPYILFVHGWNLEPWEKDRFAESAFKRLYWQGYQGRFGEFRWPTTFHASTGNTVYDDAVLAAIYDPGEYNAWQSAQGLLNKLNDLNTQYPGHVYLLAHSMGNVVAGEALRLAAQQGLGQIVNTYVASQAAVPGHCYDSTLSGNDLLNFGPSGFFGPTTANIYNNWLATNSAAAGARINFYNTNDYALSSSLWQLDEKVKPDSVIGIAPPYGYNGSSSDNPPLQSGFYSTYPPYIGPFETVLYLGNANSVSNRYEITAFAAEPRSLALGTIPDISTITLNVNLTRTTNPKIWPSDPSGHSYGDHFWHSAEFEGDYPQQQGYWSELLSAEAFNLK